VPIKKWVGAAICGPLQCEPTLLIQRSVNIDPMYPLGAVEEKFPGGMYEEEDEEDDFETLFREVFDETDLKIRKTPEVKIIHNRITEDLHRVFYIVPFECLIGALRIKPKNDGGTRLELLHWEPLDTVAQIIHPKQLELFWKAQEELQRYK